VSSEPLVSVVIPVKNGARFLPDALTDVAAQTYRRHEVVVVDGGSSDGSAKIARSFPGVRCIEQQGDGLPDAWNTGIAAARGELIAFLDSDDRWLRSKLEAQVGALARDPRADFVICHARFFLEPGKPCPPGFDPKLLGGDHVANMPSALLARRSVFEAIGNFPTDFDIASDIDWFARLKDSGLGRLVVPEALVEKRVHDSNLSYFAAGALPRELLRVLRDSVARQRG
jgi:glycosyltransferase involved in cell wall biosynthesis